MLPPPRKPSRLALWWRAHPDVRRTVGRMAAWTVAIVALVGLAVAALKALERRVLTGADPRAPQPARVCLAGVPPWMPASLASHLAAAMTPPNADFRDPALPRAVHDRARRSVWVRSVARVLKRRADGGAGGTVEVQAEFRQPVARVPVGDGTYAYIDPEAVRLPADGVPRFVVTMPPAVGRGIPNPDGSESGPPPAASRYYCGEWELPPRIPARRLHYVDIHLLPGADGAPPPVGQVWDCAALREGIRLVGLISRRPYANQITTVDVRNHNWRVSRSEPQLRMIAQVGRGSRTDIRFGRFPHPQADWVVSPARKLEYLDNYVREHDGRLAGLDPGIELRLDYRMDSGGERLD